MASKFAHSSKAMVLLVLCILVVCKTVEAGPQHVCPYPQACANPGPTDATHPVTATARYNPDMKVCSTIPSVTGPHDCQQFATIEECKQTCENTAK